MTKFYSNHTLMKECKEVSELMAKYVIKDLTHYGQCILHAIASIAIAEGEYGDPAHVQCAITLIEAGIKAGDLKVVSPNEIVKKLKEIGASYVELFNLGIKEDKRGYDEVMDFHTSTITLDDGSVWEHMPEDGYWEYKKGT